MRKRPKAHRIQQQTTMAASGTSSARARVACAPSSPAPGDPIASMTTLEGKLLLLPENLNLGGGEAKRGVGNRGDGHLVRAETCSSRDKCLGSTSRSQCGKVERTEVHDAEDQARREVCRFELKTERRSRRGKGRRGRAGVVARGQGDPQTDTRVICSKRKNDPLPCLI